MNTIIHQYMNLPFLSIYDNKQVNHYEIKYSNFSQKQFARLFSLGQLMY